MKILVKIGGTLLDEEQSRCRVARQLSDVVRQGLQLVLVHGGGKQMTRFLAERGVQSRFVNGLRVTTPEVLDAVLKVLAGSVNRQLVASLVECGIRAVGLSGVDACLTEAEPLSPELGAVGRPEFIRGSWIRDGAVVIDAGYHPGGVGDVELAPVMDRCSAYTPVPGGVGPMTIATLIAQTVEAAEKRV